MLVLHVCLISCIHVDMSKQENGRRRAEARWGRWQVSAAEAGPAGRLLAQQAMAHRGGVRANGGVEPGHGGSAGAGCALGRLRRPRRVRWRLSNARCRVLNTHKRWGARLRPTCAWIPGGTQVLRHARAGSAPLAHAASSLLPRRRFAQRQPRRAGGSSTQAGASVPPRRQRGRRTECNLGEVDGTAVPLAQRAQN